MYSEEHTEVRGSRRRAYKMRESAQQCWKVYCESGDNKQETPYALQKEEFFFWLRLGDAHSALRGWRPIPAALLSHSVLLCSGTEDIPSNYSIANENQLRDPPPTGTNYPW